MLRNFSKQLLNGIPQRCLIDLARRSVPNVSLDAEKVSKFIIQDALHYCPFADALALEAVIASNSNAFDGFTLTRRFWILIFLHRHFRKGTMDDQIKIKLNLSKNQNENINYVNNTGDYVR